MLFSCLNLLFFAFHPAVLAKDIKKEKRFDFIGPGLKIKSNLKNAEVKIGEKIVFTVNITADDNIEVEMPELNEKLKSLNINVEDSRRSRRVFFNKRFYQFKYMLSCFKPGEYTLSGIALRYKKEIEGQWQEALLGDKTIIVKSVLSEGSQGQGIKDIKGLMYPKRHVFIYLIIAVFFLAGTAVILYFLLRERVAPATEKKESAYEIALRRIKELKRKDFLGRGLVKEFYFQLSLIVRRYLEDRFDLRAPEMTTEEFLYSLKDSHALAADHKTLLKEFLFNCDLVKFAKYAPKAEEIDQALRATKNLIEQTKQEKTEGT